MPTTQPRQTLRELPFEARIVVAVFLSTVAAGYLAALTQVHFQVAAPGEMLPGVGRVQERYTASPGKQSKLEHLIDAAEGPFNGSGTMRPAFLEKSRDWADRIRNLNDAERQRLFEEREGERQALLAWIRRGGDRSAYDRDEFQLDSAMAGGPITSEFLVPGKYNIASTSRQVRIRTLIEKRCVDCHNENGRLETARLFPLQSYEQLQPYLREQPVRGMSLSKLAQSSHVHLLGFAVLYGATGLLFCFTSYGRSWRLFVSPLPLAAQAADILCWWLARWDAFFAYGIVAAGTLAGIGLFIHVVGILWDLFERRGKTAIVCLIIATAAASLAFKFGIVDPYLEREQTAASAEP